MVRDGHGDGLATTLYRIPGYPVSTDWSKAPDDALAHVEEMRSMTRRRYWYFITDYYCPACNRSERFRERRYDVRPKDYALRHDFIEQLDGCVG